MGQTVTFTCVVERIPTPTVTWYHNGGNPRGVTSVSGSNCNINTLTFPAHFCTHATILQAIEAYTKLI